MGGQIPNNLALKLDKAGANIIGTSADSIDNAEDRNKFSKLLDEIGVDQPEWEELASVQEAKKFAKNVGYPVLVRPSYVLSGAAMAVASDDEELVEFLSSAVHINPEYPVVISKFIQKAKEIEIDAVAQDGNVILSAMSEHVELAGVHSGDATMVLPPQRLYLETIRRIREISRQICKGLKITGPFNIQFIAKDNHIKVIECNLRASRSFPFVSKVSKKNFIDAAIKLMLGKKLKPNGSTLDLDYVGVKAPQFSFTRLKKADPVLGVEMASTGEVGCLGDTLHEAFLKSVISTGMKLPEKSVLVSIGGDDNRYRLMSTVKTLTEMGFEIYATEHTSEFLNEHNIKNKLVWKAHTHKKNNALELLDNRKVDLVINIPRGVRKMKDHDGYMIRRKSVDFAIPLINDVNIAKLFVESIKNLSVADLKIKDWGEYE